MAEISEASARDDSAPLEERRNSLRIRGNPSPALEGCVLLASMEATKRIRDLVGKEHHE